MNQDYDIVYNKRRKRQQVDRSYKPIFKKEADAEKAKKKATNPDTTDNETTAIIAAVIILLIISIFALPALLVVLPPAFFMFKEAFYGQPHPRRSRRFFGLMLICVVISLPSFYAAFVFMSEVWAYGLHFPIATTDLASYADQSDNLILALAGIFPALCFLSYAYLQRIEDKTLIKAHNRAQAQQQIEESRQQAEAKRQAEAERQREVSASRQPGNVLLGTLYNRVWDERTANWQLQLSTRLSYLTPTTLARHLIIVAPTRAGKTANIIEPMIYAALRVLAGAIFFDPKGSEFDAQYFDLNFKLDSDDSFRLCLLDPTAYSTPQQALQRLAEALIAENTDNPVFHKTSRQIFVALGLAFVTVYNQYPELADIVELANNAAQRKQIDQQLETMYQSRPNRQIAEARQLLAFAEREAGNTKSNLMTDMYLSILPLGTGIFRDYVTTNPAKGITVKQILEQRLIARIALRREDGAIGAALGRVIIQQFADAVLSPNANKDYLKLCVVDEANRFVCPAMDEITNAAAGNNAGLILVFQGLSQIRDENMRNNIFGNCKTKIVLPQCDPATADVFSRFFGKVKVTKITTSTGTSRSAGISKTTGTSRNAGTNTGQGTGTSSSDKSTAAGRSRSYNTGKSKSFGLSESEGTNESTGTSQNVTVDNIEVDLWTPSEIINNEMYHAVVYIEDGKRKPTPQLVKFYSPDERYDIESEFGDFRAATDIDPRLFVGSEPEQPTPTSQPEPPAAPKQPDQAPAPKSQETINIKPELVQGYKLEQVLIQLRTVPERFEYFNACIEKRDIPALEQMLKQGSDELIKAGAKPEGQPAPAAAPKDKDDTFL